ncbi:hypothetical protein [Chitinibacter sp. S2-10]|uniref:hypothetical protein n=1 Tax=Chitinibacter sp. S2-10 TaxID=3373597 RepID=UPI003977DD69
MLRFFFFCVMTIVLPVNTVLAQMPAHAAQQSSHRHQAASHSDSLSPASAHSTVHLHQGLFGQLQEHLHDTVPQNDCIKACQAMPSSALIGLSFTALVPISAVFVCQPVTALASLSISPLEDPPRSRV